MKYISITAVLFALIAIASAHADESKGDPGQLRYEAKEHYRFNLGGDSGFYTNWERIDLDGFDGVTTTVEIQNVYGKPTDKWAATARINLFGAGDDKNRPILGLVLEVDRKTNSVEASIYRSKDKPREAFDAKLPVGKPFNVTILASAPGKLLVSLEKTTYEVPYDFDVKSISAAGTGVDVKFEPFNLLKRVP